MNSSSPQNPLIPLPLNQGALPHTGPQNTSQTMPQDPLSQLRDIHLPEPVSWWPPAPGWWILAIIILAILFFSIRWFIKYRAQNCYRREALQQLHQVKAETDSLQQCHLLLALLRRTAKTAYPTLEHGATALESELTSSLFAKLNDCCKQPVFNDDLQKELSELPYQENPEISSLLLEQLQQATGLWIRKHSTKQHKINNSPQVSKGELHANP